jgi:hypothetical protein
VFKFAHGGKTPIEVLHVYGYYPEGCSVDRLPETWPFPTTMQTQFAEMPHGSTSFVDITLNKQLGPYPGAVQWDGKYVALVDATTNVLYRVRVTGWTGTVVGMARFKGDRSNLVAQS